MCYLKEQGTKILQKTTCITLIQFFSENPMLRTDIFGQLPYKHSYFHNITFNNEPHYFNTENQCEELILPQF
jgi:hypothetical protein